MTPGPATTSLELVRDERNFVQPVWPERPPGRVWAATAGEHGYYAYPSREVEQALFAGDHWLLVTRTGDQGDELVVLSPDWSSAKLVAGLPGGPHARRRITVVPDRERQRVIVLADYVVDPGSGRGRIDVAVLDIPHAVLEVLLRANGGLGLAVWAGDRIVASYLADDNADVMVLIDPATQAVREVYREEPGREGAPIASLWPSPYGSRVAFDRSQRYLSGQPSRFAGRNVVVVDLDVGRGAPVARDPRRSYFHSVAKWEGEDSVFFYVGEASGRASLYRAKLRPVGVKAS